MSMDLKQNDLCKNDIYFKDEDKLYEIMYSEIATMKEEPCKNYYDLTGYNKKTQAILSEIAQKRNHSWIKEIWDRNKNALEEKAMRYRGQEFTYKQFFILSYKYARALKYFGIEKGQEFICDIENIPEFPIIMGAASFVGARVNLISAEFEKEYLISMIERAEFPYIFASDVCLEKIIPAIKDTKRKITIIPIPLEFSLRDKNPFSKNTEEYYKYNGEELKKTLSTYKNILSVNQFLCFGEKYTGKVSTTSSLTDRFTITYTSGSTGWKRPKGLEHCNRSYITMGRYHDPSVSGIPSMRGKITLGVVKPMSDTDFMSNISDTFMQGGIVALEPIVDKEYFLNSMIINEPTLVIASSSYWIFAMKQYYSNPSFHNITLKKLLVPTAAGEPLTANEEKALNKWLTRIKAGVAITKFPVPIVKMSVAGGDSEHGGIFLTLFRSWQSKRISHLGIKEPIGLGTYEMVQIVGLREDGTYCEPMECGQLVANSPCTMEGYIDNETANKTFFINDAFGKTWGNLGIYGYLDKTGHTYIKGRISVDDTDIPNYKIQDIVLQDIKKILSCEVVNVSYNGEKVYVVHIEPQLFVNFVKHKTLRNIIIRCKIALGEEIVKRIYFRIHSYEESFKLLHTGKRDCLILHDEGITKAVNSQLFFVQASVI